MRSTDSYLNLSLNMRMQLSPHIYCIPYIHMLTVGIIYTHILYDLNTYIIRLKYITSFQFMHFRGQPIYDNISGPALSNGGDASCTTTVSNDLDIILNLE